MLFNWISNHLIQSIIQRIIELLGGIFLLGICILGMVGANHLYLEIPSAIQKIILIACLPTTLVLFFMPGIFIPHNRRTKIQYIVYAVPAIFCFVFFGIHLTRLIF